MRASALFLLLFFSSACATTATLGGDPGLEPDRTSALEEEISTFNDVELFACGTTSFQASDYLRAALCFARLADEFPQSRHREDAQFNAGVSYENLGAWQLALDRYRPLLQFPTPASQLDPLWRAATCLYHLGEYGEAIELLEPIAGRTDLPVTDRIHARTHVGVCRIERGELDAAERDLRGALALYRREEGNERLETYFPSQAQFFLGEIYRLRFSQISLEQTDDPEHVRDQLEYKAQLLLSAQGHYLRTLRLANAHWSTAAGQRVGALYEELYDEMMEAPVPSTLDQDQVALYRATLRRKVRVLVRKAISIYERTLAAAERTGVSSAFIDQTRESLERMRQVLLLDDALDEADGLDDELADDEEERDV